MGDLSSLLGMLGPMMMQQSGNKNFQALSMLPMLMQNRKMEGAVPMMQRTQEGMMPGFGGMNGMPATPPFNPNAPSPTNMGGMNPMIYQLMQQMMMRR